jgi:2-polyprenyl-6-methoxyphenol hydroxylase-like FAD-dependent oxidoreductase
LLSQHAIPSLVLESWDRLDERLRATQYGVPATKIFRRAGILDDIRERSIASFPSINWRRVSDGERLTGIDLSVVKDHPDRMTILPLNQIIQILYRHCMDEANGLVEVRFNHRVVDAGQDEGSAWVDVEVGNTERKRLTADYVVGCDGATSAVRKALFGRHWPGQTFDCRLLVQNVFYDGFDKHGWDGGNYMVDRDHWGLVAKRGKGGLWRVTYGDVGGLGDDEYVQRRETAFKKMLPGHPDPTDYKIEQTNQFRIHNRCVDSMRVGRVLLAADAAHVCNPFGGYGCMTAVLDVAALADCLAGVYEGKADDQILDLYATIRRDKFLKYVDARSIKNLNRISRSDPATVLDTDKFLGILKGLEGDDEGTKAFLLVRLPPIDSRLPRLCMLARLGTKNEPLTLVRAENIQHRA